MFHWHWRKWSVNGLTIFHPLSSITLLIFITIAVGTWWYHRLYNSILHIPHSSYWQKDNGCYFFSIRHENIGRLLQGQIGVFFSSWRFNFWDNSNRQFLFVSLCNQVLVQTLDEKIVKMFLPYFTHHNQRIYLEYTFPTPIRKNDNFKSWL